MVVLDAVHQIQAEQANDLAVRWNCKAGKCGSCSAEINGMPKLMCMTRMNTLPTDAADHHRADPRVPVDPRPGHRRVVELRGQEEDQAVQAAPAGRRRRHLAHAAGRHRARAGVPQVHRVLPVPGRLPRAARSPQARRVHRPALLRLHGGAGDAPAGRRGPRRRSQEAATASATATSPSAAPRSAPRTSPSPTTPSSRSRSAWSTASTIRSSGCCACSRNNFGSGGGAPAHMRGGAGMKRRWIAVVVAASAAALVAVAIAFFVSAPGCSASSGSPSSMRARRCQLVDAAARAQQLGARAQQPPVARRSLHPARADQGGGDDDGLRHRASRPTSPARCWRRRSIWRTGRAAKASSSRSPPATTCSRSTRPPARWCGRTTSARADRERRRLRQHLADRHHQHAGDRRGGAHDLRRGRHRHRHRDHAPRGARAVGRRRHRARPAGRSTSRRPRSWRAATWRVHRRRRRTSAARCRW